MWQKCFAVVASFLLAVSVLAADPFKWTKVGGDPCNPNVGCTLLASLRLAHEKLGWPKDVTRELLVEVMQQNPERVNLVPGQHIWATFGLYSFKFRPYVITAWPADKDVPALLWHTDYNGIRYTVGKVKECGNYVGWKEAIPKPQPSVLVLAQEPVTSVTVPEKPVVVAVLQPPPQRMQLGILPVVDCLE